MEETLYLTEDMRNEGKLENQKTLATRMKLGSGEVKLSSLNISHQLRQSAS